MEDEPTEMYDLNLQLPSAVQKSDDCDFVLGHSCSADRSNTASAAEQSASSLSAVSRISNQTEGAQSATESKKTNLLMKWK